MPTIQLHVGLGPRFCNAWPMALGPHNATAISRDTALVWCRSYAVNVDCDMDCHVHCEQRSQLQLEGRCSSAPHKSPNGLVLFRRQENPIALVSSATDSTSHSINEFAPTLDPSIAVAAGIAALPPILYWGRVVVRERNRVAEQEKKEAQREVGVVDRLFGDILSGYNGCDACLSKFDLYHTSSK